METTKTYTQVQNEWQGGHVYEVKCLCSRGWEWGRNGTLAKGCFLSESEIDISNCQTHMPNHYLIVEILKLSSNTVKCCISVSVLNFIQQDVKSPNNVYLFWLLTIHLFCLLFSVLITKTALLDCMPPENVSCVLITQAGKFKRQSLR